MAFEKTNGRVKVLYGSSLLRPITRSNSCKSARIPLYWCLCEYPHFIPKDIKAINSSILDAFIEEMHIMYPNRFDDDPALRRVNITEVAVQQKRGERLFLVDLFTTKTINKYPNNHRSYVEVEINGTARIASSVEQVYVYDNYA